MGRDAAARAAADARRRHHGVPRLGARRAPAQAGGNERAVARHGGDAQFRPMQSRPPDLCGIEARRYRTPVRAALTFRDARENPMSRAILALIIAVLAVAA